MFMTLKEGLFSTGILLNRSFICLVSKLLLEFFKLVLVISAVLMLIFFLNFFSL